MKSSELKPKVLEILEKMFEVDPSPNAWGSEKTLAKNVSGATEDQVLRMIEHLAHEGLVNLVSLNTGRHLSITEKGLIWVNEHKQIKDNKSLKSWLLKPVAIAVITASITAPITILVTHKITKNFTEHSQNNEPKCP